MSTFAQRDSWIEQWCARIDKIVIARAARYAMATSLPTLSVVVELPSFVWKVPAINVGRKGVDRATGQSLELPIRVTWEGGAVHTVTSHSAQYTWQASGMGYELSGVVTVSLDRGVVQTSGDSEESLSLASQVRSILAPSTFAVLEELGGQENSQRWALMTMIEPMVQRSVKSASFALGAELNHMTHHAHGMDPNALDELAREALCDTMMYGESGDNASYAARLIERCIEPQAYVKVDPLRKVATDIKRSAGDSVRQSIGDPRIGTRFRNLARSLGSVSLQDAIEAYNDKYPYDKLSVDRAISALDVAPLGSVNRMELTAEVEEMFMATEARYVR